MASVPPIAAATSSRGTRHTPYRPVAVKVSGDTTGDFDLFNCLCMQDEFKNFSQEEHRLADYEIDPALRCAATSDSAPPKRISARECDILAFADHEDHEDSDISDDSPFQTRKDGMHLLLTEPCEIPQVCLPPLDGFDASTVRRLYSPLVADMVRIHPKLVAWIGASAIEMIESLVTKEGSFDEEIETQVADLKFQVMKAKLGEAKAKQALNTMKKEKGVTLQISPATVNFTNSPHYSLTSQQPCDFRGTNMSRTVAANAVSGADGFSTSSFNREQPFTFNAREKISGNWDTPKLSLGSNPLPLPSEASSSLFPFPLYTGKLGQASTLKPAQYVSPYGPLHPIATSNDASNPDKIFSGAPRDTAVVKPPFGGSLTSSPKTHERVLERDLFALRSGSNVSTNSGPASTLREPAMGGSSRRNKRAQDDRPRRDSYRPAKKARRDGMLKREDERQ